MTEDRLADYLDHMWQAATDARGFVDGLGKDDFLADKRTQQAVIMSLIIIGEAATRVMDGYADFTQAHLDLAMAYFNTGDKAKALDLFSEFKKRYYQRLSPADREKLDSFIEQCRKEPD